MTEQTPKEEHYSVRWTSHSNNLIHMFTEHRLQDRLADVTLDLFKMNIGICGTIIHPFIVFTGEKFSYLTQIIQFMYQGEIKVPEADLEGVLAMGEKFQVKGLCTVRVKHQKIVEKPKSVKDDPDIDKSASKTPASANNSTGSTAVSPVIYAVPSSANIPPVILNSSAATHQLPHNIPVLPNLVARQADHGCDVQAAPSKQSTSQHKPLLVKQLHSSSRHSLPVTVESYVHSKSHVLKQRPAPVVGLKVATIPGMGLKRAATPIPTEKTQTVLRSKSPDKEQPVKKKHRVESPVVQASSDARDTSEKRLEIDDVQQDELNDENRDTKQTKPLTPFMVFASEWRKKVEVEHPGETNKEISLRLSNLWKTLSFETKQSYYASVDAKKNKPGKQIVQRRKTVDSISTGKRNNGEGSVHIIDSEDDMNQRE